jgi:hypothetical protein
MRTTLEIGDDVLEAVRSLAEREGRTLGEVLTDLARKALTPATAPKVRTGVPLLSVRKGTTVDLELVNRLRDEE